MKRHIREHLVAYLFILPALISLGMFKLYPMVRNIVLSFTSWNLILPNRRFIGLENYKEMFSSKDFYGAIKVTLIYTVLFVGLSMILGLLISMLLSRNNLSNKVFRTSFFTPTVTSMVAMASVWLFIYHPQYGPLNMLLDAIGIPKVRWLNDSSTALISLILMNVWKRMGFAALVYLGAIQNIPQSMLEAADMDGANAWQKFRKIKLPMIAHASFLLLIMMTIESFQIFTQINVMTEGGPNRSTTNLLTFMYNEAFSNMRIGYGSAIATIFLIIVLTIYLIQSLYERRISYDRV